MYNFAIHFSRICSLQILKTVTDYCHPRSKFYSADIVKHLLRLLVDIHMSKADTCDEETEVITQVLKDVPDRTLVIESVSGLVSAFQDDLHLRNAFEKLHNRLI